MAYFLAFVCCKEYLNSLKAFLYHQDQRNKVFKINICLDRLLYSECFSLTPLLLPTTEGRIRFRYSSTSLHILMISTNKDYHHQEGLIHQVDSTTTWHIHKQKDIHSYLQSSCIRCRHSKYSRTSKIKFIKVKFLVSALTGVFTGLMCVFFDVSFPIHQIMDLHQIHRHCSHQIH